MAPKNGLRRLLSDFRRAYATNSGARWTTSAHAIRSTHGPTNQFYESPALASNIRSVDSLPLLSRQLLDFFDADGHPTLFAALYMKDATHMSQETLAADIARVVRQPKDESLLSRLHSSHEFAKAVLLKLPSTRHVYIRRSGPEKVNGMALHLGTSMSRNDPLSSTENTSSFVLSVKFKLERNSKNIGPSYSPSPSKLRLELHLRPKASLFLAALGKSADEPIQSTEGFAAELLDDLRRSVLLCKFTSVVSFNEAVAVHLKDSFCRSKYDQYLELESVRVYSSRRAPGRYYIRWIHEPSCLNTSLYRFDLGYGEGSHMIRLRHKKSPEAGEVKANPMSVFTLYLYKIPADI